jgi:anti-anti-sigma factor
MELCAGALLDVPLLVVGGDIDHFTAGALREAALTALPDTGGRLLLDMSSCRYMDSGGLSVLLVLLRDMGGEGWLGVIGPDQNLRRMFEILGLMKNPGFLVFATIDDASRFLAKTGR